MGICIYFLTIIKYKFIINLSNIDYRIQQVNVTERSNRNNFKYIQKL